MELARKTNFLYFILFINIISCQRRQNVEICKEKFLASYFTLSTMPNYTYDNYNNIPVNMSDSAKIYLNCMFKAMPNNIENYIWQAKTHFILKEYDSLIYSVKNISIPVDKDFKYAFESLTGIGYEKINMKDSAIIYYKKALDLVEGDKDNIPLDYAFTKFLIENNNRNFKVELEMAIEKFQEKKANDSMYKIYLNEIEKIPFEEKRETIIDNIVARYDMLFYQKPN